MEKKIYTAIGLMSGTSMDGVDASIIRSDGFNHFENILDKYYEFDEKLYEKLVNLRNLVLIKDDLNTHSNKLATLEKEITIFHSEIVNNIISNHKNNIDLIGFHGQTIYHNPTQKISKQLGDGRLLSQLTRKKVVYDFRQKDLKNGGQGAPLTPIFHSLIARHIHNKNYVEYPINILNIGGISNITRINSKDIEVSNNIEAYDIGPGNCLINNWIRENSNKRFDENGLIAKSGKINKNLLNQALENFNINSYNNSLDVKDFDISFARGLSCEDGCATITNFTAFLIAEGIKFINQNERNIVSRYLICGGGRKNSFLIETIKDYLSGFNNLILESIDNYNLNGDYIESQAFGFLGIRSLLNLPISFPKTTRCKSPTSGGILIKNY
ncbi:MAG: anhydro-N-acetylmuramic acid kinase [Pelagibacteraceae bacterium]|nr:anhydro-N-acetylmuramic acid kinase [Pelagibacteraceae bacterium]PHX88862.1 MAG: anhydro-N-acetylmuramic acid kinase [Pelagibacteraceae bacterium]